MSMDGGGIRRTAKGCAAGSRGYPWRWQEVGRLTSSEGEMHRCSVDNEQRCNSFNGAL